MNDPLDKTYSVLIFSVCFERQLARALRALDLKFGGPEVKCLRDR